MSSSALREATAVGTVSKQVVVPIGLHEPGPLARKARSVADVVVRAPLRDLAIVVDIRARAADDRASFLTHLHAQIDVFVAVAISLVEAAAHLEQPAVDQQTRPRYGLELALLVDPRKRRVQMGIEVLAAYPAA